MMNILLFNFTWFLVILKDRISVLLILLVLFHGINDLRCQNFSVGSMAVPYGNQLRDFTVNSDVSRIYYGGVDQGNWGGSLKAVDIKGNTLSWNPDCDYNGVPGNINSIVYYRDTIIAGGLFLKVNGKPQKSLAKIDTNGILCKWTLPFSLQDCEVLDLELHRNRNLFILYYKLNDLDHVHLKVLDLYTNSLLDSVNIPAEFRLMSNVSNFIEPQYFFFRIKGDYLWIYDELSMELGVNEIVQVNGKITSVVKKRSFYLNDNIVALDVDSLDTNSSKAYVLLNSLYYPYTNYPLKGNLVKSITYKKDDPSAGIDTWNVLDPLDAALFSLALTDLNLIYSGKDTLMEIYCANKKNTSNEGKIKKVKLFDKLPSPHPDLIYPLMMKRFNDKLIAKHSYEYNGIPNLFLSEELMVFAIAPERPRLRSSPEFYCRDSLYEIMVFDLPGNISYDWYYSGKGATIPVNGKSAAGVKFSFSATEGYLVVKSRNEFGFVSEDSLLIPIKFHSLPAAIAMNDTSLTCKKSQIVLNGSSSDMPHSIFSWLKPGKMAFVMADSVLADTSGEYIFKITSTLNSCFVYDTTLVSYDTLPPLLNTLMEDTIYFTCKQDSFILKAYDYYSVQDNKMLWTQNGINYMDDPYTIYYSGPSVYDIFLLIESRKNGCKSIDNIWVGSMYSPVANYFVDTILSLNCERDSVMLNAGSVLSSLSFLWTDTSGTKFSNASYVSNDGFYQLMVKDSVSGCKNIPEFFEVETDTSKPVFVMPPASVVINCSYSSALLHISSKDASLMAVWSGPGSYSHVDPALVVDTGVYVVNVTKLTSGCIVTDSFRLKKDKSLTLAIPCDTSLCHGSSLFLDGVPVGGTIPFKYIWSSGDTSSSVLFAPESDTSISLIVLDAEGCLGDAVIKVNVAPALKDSAVAYQPCDLLSADGHIFVYPYGGIPPYLYSINSGITWQDSGLFSGLGYAQYQVLIKDSLACTIEDTATINKNSFIANAAFLVNTFSYLKDTFALIDISTPRADSVDWLLPLSALIIDSSDMHAPIVLYSDTGKLKILMTAFFGSCRVNIEKTIHVSPFDSSMALYNSNKGIKEFRVSPNPNSGQFSYTIAFYHKQDFLISLYDPSANEIYRRTLLDGIEMEENVVLQSPVAGTYFLKAIGEFDSRYILIVIAP